MFFSCRYLNNPAATAETIMQNGFLRTGDIAYEDEDGSAPCPFFLAIVPPALEMREIDGGGLDPPPRLRCVR